VLFQSWQFLILMTVVVIGLILLRQRTLQHLLILVASWVFYASWEPIFLTLLLYCTVNDYALGLAIGYARSQRAKNRWLLLSLITNLGLLGIFKYANFFVDSVNQVLEWQGYYGWLPVLNITLPIGISFYTFHSMGYNIDVYRGKEPERSFLRFAIYVAYFPQLVAGPILRAGQFLPQLKSAITFTGENVRSGAHLFLVGLVKKIVVADNIAIVADGILGAPQSLPSIMIWLGIFAFGIQIYCDFSGYTDMARGLSRMMGIEIPINFNYPYLATSITDFWRRWHISLSSWLRDYLYIPLGGNRYGTLQTYRNLMLTMGLGGLWHGASWNFVLWGLYQGGLLSVERLTGLDRPPQAKADSEPRPRFGAVGWLLAWIVCQYFVLLGWLLFRVTNTADLWYCVQKFVVFDFNFQLSSLGLGRFNPFLVFLVIGGFCVLHVVSWSIGGIANRLNTASRPVQFVTYVLAVFALIAFWPQHAASFIYFQF
jgi:alginate O-acetyltransferase complex protein AlgI